MQKLLIQRFSKVAALAMIAALATSSAARADLIVTFAESGGGSGGPTTLASGAPSDGGGTGVVYSPGGSLTFGDFKATGVGLSETQTSALSEVLSGTFTFTNTSTTTAHTLTVTVQATGFTAPTTPPSVLLLEHIGGTSPSTGSGVGNTISFSSQAGAAPTAPTLSPDITGFGASYSQDGNQTITSGLTGTYTVTQTFTITLNAGASVQITGRTDLMSTPEPSTAAIAGLGALGLIGYGVRRRTAKGA